MSRTLGISGTRDTWTRLHLLSTTDYLTYEGGKSPNLAGLPADVWRYFLLSLRPETANGEFTWDKFIGCNNNLLLKNLGNYISRVHTFVNSRHYNNIVPDWTTYDDSASLDAFKKEINKPLTQ